VNIYTEHDRLRALVEAVVLQEDEDAAPAAWQALGGYTRNQLLARNDENSVFAGSMVYDRVWAV
jgi:hypothetical protein